MRKIVYILFAMFVGAMFSCSNNTGEKNMTTSGLLKMACEQSFENILNQEIEVFEYNYPNANILSYYIDENSAIDSLVNMKLNLIVTGRKLTQEQQEYIKSKGRIAKQQRLAVDAIALIVNNANPVSELTMSDLRGIFSGKIKRWGDLEPTTLKNDSIIVVFDHQGSNITKYVRDSILNGEKFLSNVFAQNGSEEVFNVIENKKNAIGLIGVSWITADMKGKSESVAEKVKRLNQNDTTVIDFSNRIKVLKVSGDDSPIGYKPYQAYIFDGRYPLFRSIYVISIAAPGSIGQGFYSFMTSYQGQKIIQNTGVLPAAVQPRIVSIE